LGRKTRFIPALAWAATISIASLVPKGTLPEVGCANADKMAHFAFYAGLAFLSLWALGKKAFDNRRKKNFIKIFLSVSLYGLALEIAQYNFTTTRSFDLFDIVANVLGTLTGVFLFNIIFINKQCL
jgi:VanZ family protein